MNYTKILEFLYNSLPQFQRIGAAAYKAGLDTTIALDNHLSNPHTRYKTIHIAGTNGKGSTSQIIYEALSHCGYKVGLYTSPHLIDFRERIVVQGEMIPQDAVVEFVQSNMSIIGDLKPSFFEMTVAMALWWFAECGVDYAVVEVGMGGVLDSTNIITPELSLITNISLDHTHFLGATIPEIATQKAGIIKRGVPVVVGQSDDRYNRVFTERAAELGAPITFADREPRQPYQPAMQGAYQCYNAQSAVVALRLLGVVGEQSVRYGVESAKVRGRWQVLGHSPLTICDTAHNEAGLKEVVAQLSVVQQGQLYFVLGVVSDKDLDGILPLMPTDATYIFTQPSVPRAMAVEELCAWAEKYSLRGESTPTVEAAIKRVRQLASPRDTIFIGGSTFTVADALSLYYS